jgi:hypothetical protein
MLRRLRVLFFAIRGTANVGGTLTKAKPLYSESAVMNRPITRDAITAVAPLRRADGARLPLGVCIAAIVSVSGLSYWLFFVAFERVVHLIGAH